MKGAVAVNILFKTRLEATEYMTQNCTFRNTNSVSEITWSWKSYHLRKALFSKCFSSKQKRKAVIFKFLQFKERFRKARYRDGLIWTVSLTVEIKLRFRDGLIWTVSLTVEIKLRLRDSLIWTVSLTVEIKLRFCDSLIWTVSLTVEIKLRFRDSLIWTVSLTVEKKLRFRDDLI